MARRSRGLRSAGRGKYTKPPRRRGIGSVVQATKDLPMGARVAIFIDPSVHRGQPHHRYHGRVGLITEKRGRAYVVEIKDGGKIKKIIASPEHLKVVR